MPKAELSPLAGEAALARHIAYERERRGWSTNKLARLLNDVGSPINQSAVWKIENAERKITVDELLAFAKVFEFPIARLLEPPSNSVFLELAQVLDDANATGELLASRSVELGPLLDRLAVLARTADQAELIEAMVRPLLNSLESAASAIVANKRTTTRILKGATRGKR